MPESKRRGHSIRIHADDLLFLEQEALRLRRERFRRTRTLDRPSHADVVASLLDELRRRRAREGRSSKAEGRAERPRSRTRLL